MTEPVKRRYKSLRLWQFIVCAVCFGLSVSSFVTKVQINEFVKTILFVTASAFLFLTTVDIIMISMTKEIYWMPWLLISVAATLLFFLSTGFLSVSKSHFESIVYEVMIVSFLVGGILFLLDIIFTIYAYYLTLDGSGNTASNTYHAGSSSKNLDKPTQTELISCQRVQDRPDTIEAPTNDVILVKKMYPPCISSHGGTFHVSRTVVPISTVPLEEKKREVGEGCDCDTVKIRTIAIGVKPVLKRTDDMANTSKTTPPPVSQCIKHGIKSQVLKEDNYDDDFGPGRPRNIGQFVCENPDCKSGKQKTTDYSVYQCTRMLNRNQFSPLRVDPNSQSVTEHNRNMAIRPRTSTKRRFQSQLDSFGTGTEDIESHDYMEGFHNFIYPVDRFSPRSRDEYISDNSEKPIYDSSLVQQPTILPGEVDTQQANSPRIGVRKHTIERELSRDDERKVYLRVLESIKLENSEPSRPRKTNKSKQSCPLM